MFKDAGHQEMTGNSVGLSSGRRSCKEWLYNSIQLYCAKMWSCLVAFHRNHRFGHHEMLGKIMGFPATAYYAHNTNIRRSCTIHRSKV